MPTLVKIRLLALAFMATNLTFIGVSTDGQIV